MSPSRHAAVSRPGRVRLVFNFNGTGCRKGDQEKGTPRRTSRGTAKCQVWNTVIGFPMIWV